MLSLARGLPVPALADDQVDLVAASQSAAGLRALLEHVVLEPVGRSLPGDAAHAAVVLPDLRLGPRQRVALHVRNRAGWFERRWRRRRWRRRRWRRWWRRRRW